MAKYLFLKMTRNGKTFREVTKYEERDGKLVPVTSALHVDKGCTAGAGINASEYEAVLAGDQVLRWSGETHVHMYLVDDHQGEAFLKMHTPDESDVQS
jgi:hypothetical protein